MPTLKSSQKSWKRDQKSQQDKDTFIIGDQVKK